MNRCLFHLGSIVLAFVGPVSAADNPAPAKPKLEFNRHIRPILADKCFACHGPDASHRKAELRLDTPDGAKADLGGRSAIVPKKPDDSELVVRTTSDDDTERMPPRASGKELSKGEIALLKRWIAEGAEYQPHWSFIPPKRVAVPSVKNTAWPRGDIDRFLLARLEREGIAPSPEAEKITLVRRLYFDLTALPPTPDEVSKFVTDKTDDAYEKLVDRLLASPHYGERMAMYWLDLVRYANTVGYHGDQEHAISPYRDWVIKSFNDDLPFDRFTIDHLAGDLLPDATIDQKIASGYNRLLQTSHEGGVQVKEYLAKYSADRVRNLGGVWMGASLGCVECHSHKFDPYTHRDFYALAAFFADVDDLRTFKGGDTNPTKREPEMEVLSPLDRAEIERLEMRAAEIAKLLAAVDKSAKGEETLSAAQAESLRKELAAIKIRLETLRKQIRRSMITVSVEPRPIRILARGDWMDDTGEVVEPAVPGFMKQTSVTDRRLTRLDLARWLTSPDHPQTARVFVNRLWYLFFGGGLSNSLDDTGSQGEWPEHPELLDYLAVEFSSPTSSSPNPQPPAPSPPSSWSVKRLIRTIVTSAAYRQSSRERPDLRDRDPNNRLFARQTAFRLAAEMIRDNALAVSGLLVDRLGGPTAHPYQPAGYYRHLNFPKRDYKSDADENQYRRGVYVHWQRQYLHPMLAAFDAPTREECTTRRPISNTPSAALTLLNDPTFLESARALAGRTLREGGDTDDSRLRWTWVVALSRPPAPEEIALLQKLLAANREIYRENAAATQKLLTIGLSKPPDDLDKPELAAWTATCRAVLNLHEGMTRY